MDTEGNKIDGYIINIFYLISEYELSSNTLKQTLNDIKDFNPEVLYSFFDKDRKGKVGPRDFISFFVYFII
jgi:hypothetical protein